MSAATESAAGRAVAEKLPEASAQAQARTPAREVTPPTALPVLLPGSDTESPISPQVREALRHLLGAFAIPKGTNVLHASGLHATHLRHKKAAEEWSSPAATALRRAWGWLHLLLIDAPGKTLGWLTESPPRFAAAVALYYICTHWL